MQLLEDLNDLIIKSNSDARTIFSRLRVNKVLIYSIIKATSYLPEKSLLSERVYRILNNKDGVGKCIVCGNASSFITFNKGYAIHCSRNCTIVDLNIEKKKKLTFIAKYGVDNPSKVDEFIKKKETTWLTKYGVSHPFKSKEVQEKRKKTWETIYGADHISKSYIIKEKKKNTCIAKYGVDNPSKLDKVKDKKIKSSLLHFGVDYPLQSDEIKIKYRNTCLSKYGVDSPSKVTEVKDKIKKINIERYGVACALQNEKIKQKGKETCIKKYGVPHFSESIEYKNNILLKSYNSLFRGRLKFNIIPLFNFEDYLGVAQSNYLFKCTICTTEFFSNLHNGRIPRCPKCANPNSTSMAELEIFERLQLLNIQNIIHKTKNVISPYELDIYLPDYKLAIEFNGLYWHSELNGKDKNYHLNKTKLCNKKEIQLIHIFEDEWIYKQEIVKSIIKNKLGIIDNKIQARKCEIREVSQEDSYNFLFNNHLQESIYSKYNYGLYYNNELIQLLCLSKPRFNKKYQYELIRSCSKINTQIIGGFDKLTKYAVNALNITSLISYVDKRYFNGSGYRSNWKFIKETKPDYFYMNYRYLNRCSRIKYQKHKLKELFSEYYDDTLTEWQIMQLAGYDRIWDCGNLVFEYNFNFL